MKLHKYCGENDMYFYQFASPVEIFPTETAVQDDVNIFTVVSLFPGEKGENIILLNEIKISLFVPKLTRFHCAQYNNVILKIYVQCYSF